MTTEDRGDDFTPTEDEVVDDQAGAGDDKSAAEKLAEAKQAELDRAEKEAEEKAAAKAKEEEEGGERIPRKRFNEAVGKEREAREAAEKRLAEAEAKLKEKAEGLDPEKVEKEIAELEDALDKAIADGNAEMKRTIRAQIREKTTALADQAAASRAAYATAMAVERIKYDTEVARLEAAHPEMNPDSDKYDEALTGEMIELKAAYEAAGMGSTDALKKAAKFVFRDAPAAAKKEVETPEAKAAAEAKAKAEAEAKAKAAAEAKEKQVRAALEAKGKQPAAAAAGTASDKGGKGAETPVSKMSTKEFDKLSEEDKARLRGDML